MEGERAEKIDANFQYSMSRDSQLSVALYAYIIYWQMAVPCEKYLFAFSGFFIVIGVIQENAGRDLEPLPE